MKLDRLVASTCLSITAMAAGQSINVDIGEPGTGPDATYAAAGWAGHWNSIQAPHNSTTFNLIAIDGTTTDVSVWQFGGTSTLAFDDPATTGDDAKLLEDYLVTYTVPLETCLFFHDLDPGTYEVTIYAWTPGQPDVLSYTSCDEAPGVPHYTVGGAWPGGHAEGITYSRHTALVTGTGLLRVHSGIAPGADPVLGAAFSGIQIRIIEDCPADVDGSGAVDFGDLLDVLSTWGLCPGCPTDLDGDAIVGFSDLLIVLSSWGSCE